jgi:lipoprotein-releasing system ATP-binding protein
MTQPVLQLSGINRSFKQGGASLDVLRNADLALFPGQSVALVAQSGTGKSTLLHIAGLLERPDSGEVFVRNEPTTRIADKVRTALRRDTIGFVYQFHHLLPEFSALENIVVPQLIRGQSHKAARQRAEELLGHMGLAARATHRPAQLSGGEQQRVAIARAVANGPAILLADEPTGNLDPTTAESVMAAIETLVNETGLSVLFATHNLDLARRMMRRVTLQDGRVIELP